MTMPTRLCVLLTTTILAAAPAWAWAQNTSPSPTRPETGNPALNRPAPGKASDQPSDANNASQVEEIVVTAQKREQRLADVPIAVTAIGGDQLKRQNIVSATELQYAAPELTFTAGPSANYQVRGIGTATFTRSAENDVAVVVDGVIQGQLQPPVNSLFDIQRVEILSGPQGMLFGKNASAGVINIVTNAPNPAKYEAIGHIDVGEHGYQVYQGTVNLPVASNAAFRISGFSNGESGLVKDVVTGKNIGDFTDAGGRIKFLWEPTSALTVNLIGDYEKDHGGNFVWQVRQASGALAALLASCGVKPGSQNTTVCLDGPSSEVTESYGFSGQVDWRLGDFTITSITADRQYIRNLNEDSDATRINILDTNIAHDYDNQFSQELRLASPSGGLVEYVAGLYYYNYEYKPLVNQAGGLGVLPAGLQAERSSIGKIRQLSYAVFGQATVHVTDRLGLIFGGRETRDVLSSRSTNYVDPAYGIAIPGFTNPPGTTRANVDTDNFSYRIGGQYKFARDGLLYLTYSRGYKGAAINNLDPGVQGNTVIQPEIPLDLEGGIKTSLFERRLVLDISLYHQIFKNFQAQVVSSNGGVTSYIFGNASKLVTNGVQANFQARPFAGLSLNGGVIYNDATYGDFVVPCSKGYTVGCTTTAVGPVINARGRQLALAPKWKLVLAAEYDHDLGNRFEGFVQTDANYRTEVNTSAAPDPNLRIGGYALWNGRLGVRTRDGRYSLGLFAKNILDQRSPTIVFLDPLQPANGYDQSFSPNAFRTVGVSLDARF